jgi:hypothetical protein
MRPLRAARTVRARRVEPCLSEALRSLRSRMEGSPQGVQWEGGDGHVCWLICLCVCVCACVCVVTFLDQSI